MAFKPPVSAMSLASMFPQSIKLFLICFATSFEPVNATPAILLLPERYEPTSEPLPKHN